MLPEQRSKLQQDFVMFYDSVITYINKCFDLSSENVLVQLKPIGLYDELSFPDLEYKSLRGGYVEKVILLYA